MTSKEIEKVIKRIDRIFGTPFPSGIEGTGLQNQRATLEVAYQMAKLNEKIDKGIGIRNA